MARKRRKPAPVPAATSLAAAPGRAPAPGSAYSIEVLNRAINVLSVFSQARPALSLTDIVKAAGLPKTTVFRVLSNLVERDFCELDPQTGQKTIRERKSGDVIWHDKGEDSPQLTNQGKKPYRTIVIELK